MSPLIIDRIKKANGQVRVVPAGGLTVEETAPTNKWSVQVLEGGAWISVFTGDNRQICEQTVRRATSQVILG